MLHELILILIVVFNLLVLCYMAKKARKEYQKGYDTAWVDRQIFDGKLRNKKIRRSPNGQFTNVK